MDATNTDTTANTPGAPGAATEDSAGSLSATDIEALRDRLAEAGREHQLRTTALEALVLAQSHPGAVAMRVGFVAGDTGGEEPLVTDWIDELGSTPCQQWWTSLPEVEDIAVLEPVLAGAPDERRRVVIELAKCRQALCRPWSMPVPAELPAQSAQSAQPQEDAR